MTESTLGARLLNAENIVTHLQSINNYQPLRTAESVAEPNNLIADIKSANTDVVSASEAYATAVAARQEVFSKGENSIRNLSKSIRAAVKGTFGKDSQEAKQVNGLVQKIQGEKPVVVKEGDTERKISQNQQSFGSVTEHFTNIVTLLVNKGNAYAPGNAAISAASLQAMVTGLPQLNFNVTAAFNTLSSKREQRSNLYDELSDRMSRVKDAVKSQYGEKSTEYTLIKKLKV